MDNIILQKTIALRAEVWRGLTNSPAFQSFKALDTAVAAMGGRRILADESAEPAKAIQPARYDSPRLRRRSSQGDAAEAALRDAGAPMTIRTLLEFVTAKGVTIRGEDPLANFRSSLSRDARFKSIMRQGLYFWWLADVELPEGWKEAVDPDLPGLSTASDSNNQGGGEGHAANNTNLAS